MPDATPISEAHALRIEAKLDRLNTAVEKLVLIDERQVMQGQRVGKIEDRMAELEKAVATNKSEVDKWRWVGTGAWVVLTTLFALAQAAVWFYIQFKPK